MAAQRVNVSLPSEVLQLLDSHVAAAHTSRSAYVASALRRSLVTDALAQVAAQNEGRLPYADELDGIDEAA